MRSLLLGVIAATLCAAGCSNAPADTGPQEPKPWILLVTLDTTRADAIGPEARGVQTPAFNAVAARGRHFRQAYATVPETLPSHSSMMTGLYPAGHGVHENARFLRASHPVVAERLQHAGYKTAAFVSSFVLARRFGLARGFQTYDDELGNGAVERSSIATTDRALAYLTNTTSQPQLLWIHYFDPHTPYAPPAHLRERYGATPYLGEIAAVDEQLGRLVTAFDQTARRHGSEPAIIIVSDHGEGLGDHGESQHGNLLYQSTMHVPLAIAGPGVSAGRVDEPVSTRRIFHTILDWAGLGSTDSLRGETREVVLGEAMKPYLSYGWQPQIMAVEGGVKAILAGRIEAYDLFADPAENKNLGSGASLPAGMRKALDDYPVPSPDSARAPEHLSDEARRSLASLGYVSGGSAPLVRKDAPRPADMAPLFDTIDRASGLFVNERYREVIPLLQQILQKDPYNLDATLRLATAHSMLRHDAPALEMFRKAASLAPKSDDVRLYLALHYARGQEWPQAAPILEKIVADTPDRVAAVEGLAVVRERQGRVPDAVMLRDRLYELRPATADELVRLGDMAMSVEHMSTAIESFEKARAMQGRAFGRDLELGVLYIVAKRYTEARDALDRVPRSHPDYPMVLFKRAQVSVLLNEPEREQRIEAARRAADATTRELIARERLFQR